MLMISVKYYMQVHFFKYSKNHGQALSPNGQIHKPKDQKPIKTLY